MTPERRSALLFDASTWKASVHGDKDCEECHSGFEEFPHGSERESVSCADCHDEAAEALGESVHGTPVAGRTDLPVSCAACHGVHDVFKNTDRRSRLYPLNVYKACGTCHFSVDVKTATVEEVLHEPYSDDSHAHGLLHAGLVVSATCVSCHGGHGVRRRGDPLSRVSRKNVDQVCGSCHVKVLEDYRTSVHHLRSTGAEHRGATCSDCHPPHEITRPDTGFKVAVIDTCSRCHEERAGTFRRTYHGKVSSLGYGRRVATCEDCHGAHAIRPRTDPRSRIHPDNLVSTCGACHPGSHEGFVTYQVHSDPDDAEAHPGLATVKRLMVWLLVSVFSLGGLHVMLWLVRALIAREWKEPRGAIPGARYLRRWRPLYVGLHVVVMCSVLLLALTGIPLHYSDHDWSITVTRALGGAGVTAFIHRTAALALSGAFLIYLMNIAGRLLVSRERGLFSGPNTMLPRYQDVLDFVANVRWFLGLGPKPRFDRWTYWEKFDFWAVFWGMGVIGGSGLVLWFPEIATRVVPGSWVNAAQVVHGHEALLAVGFLFTIHLFHTHLRPDKFPMDLVFYTGRMAEAEFRRDRPLEYERALEAGNLEDLVAREPRKRRRVGGRVLGGITVCLGLLLLWGIVVSIWNGPST